MRTLVFQSLDDLKEFQIITGQLCFVADTERFECIGPFTDAQLELAINGLNASIRKDV